MAEPVKTYTCLDINRFVTDNERQFRSEVFGEDGTWRPFMRAIYTRQR